MNILCTDITETEQESASWSDTHNCYFASKPISIWMTVDLNGHKYDLCAQGPDSPEIHDYHEVVFNTSLDINDNFDHFIASEQVEIVKFAQKIYDHYEFDEKAYCERWEQRLKEDEECLKDL